MMYIDNFINFLIVEYTKKKEGITTSSLLSLPDAKLRSALEKKFFYEELIEELPAISKMYNSQIENDTVILPLSTTPLFKNYYGD